MNQSAPIHPDQEEMFGLTKKTHTEALKTISEVVMGHAKETSQTPTNAMQFAAIDGFMAAAGQILAAMTVDTIQGTEMKESEVLEGAIGVLFTFQKTIQNIFDETLKKANMEGVDVDAMVEKFEAEYKKAKAGQ